MARVSSWVGSFRVGWLVSRAVKDVQARERRCCREGAADGKINDGKMVPSWTLEKPSLGSLLKWFSP